MRLASFTALLAQISLDDVLKKLKSLNIDTVELGTGNYPGDPHCKLSMLENEQRTQGLQKEAGGQRLHHQRAELPRQSAASRPGASPRTYQETQPQDHSAGRKTGRAGGDRFLRLPGRQRQCQVAELGDLPVAAGLPGLLDWQWEKKVMPYWTKHGQVRRQITA